ncbi:MAG TPA: fused MFS/spermidine synthase, partial [Burkholderiales bacterium]|nr:fused MFS/spermidine synthase [Burkholderiales bacterium]
REFAVRFYGNELTFGLVLAAWLLWGGIGSLAGPKLKLVSDALPRLYTAAIGLFFLTLAGLRFSHRLLGVLPGELTGLVPALAIALLLAFFTSFPLGLAFVWNANLVRNDPGRVYLLESLGAAAAGVVVQLVLIPRFSNWQGAALVAAAAGLGIFWAFRRRRTLPLLAGTLAAAALFAAADFPSLKLAWQPFDLLEARDTRYGKLQAIKTGDQVSLYSNGLPLLTFPNVEAAEEAVHFALLQRPRADDVLLIGGGVGGGCGEVLKYSGTRLDYVEIDPETIRMAERHLPAQGLEALRDPRVRVIFEDGRAFLERTGKTYDAILLDLPEPATALINRFYTLEFFALVRTRLRPAGVLSFVVPSAENYISGDLGKFLASLKATLGRVFPEVAVVPGESNVFLASDSPLTTDPARLNEALERRGVHNKFISPEMLPSRLSRMRVDYLEDRVRKARGLVNRDLIPVSYYFHSVLWAAQFRGAESKILRFLSGIPPFWTLDAPLLLAAAILAFIALKKRRTPARFLVPLAVAGFTSILAEMAVLIIFQSAFGYVYGKISLLVAAFMAGLFVGSLAGLGRKNPAGADLAAVQAGFAALLVLTLRMAEHRGPEVFPFLCLAAFGTLSGYLFVVANKLFLRETPHAETGYGIDLLGSFAGAVLASAFVIPLLGVPRLLTRLAVLNILGFLFSLTVGLPGGHLKGSPNR